METKRRIIVGVVGIAVLVGVGVLAAFVAPKPVLRSSTSNTPHTATIRGEVVCLPHRTMSGPQTLECAYGIRADDGWYYALRDSDPKYGNIAAITVGTTVTAAGMLTLMEDATYQSSGVLEVSSITRVGA